jgi:hypothetical protein
MRKQVNLSQSDMFKSFEPGQKVKLKAQAGHYYYGVISDSGKSIWWNGAGTSMLEEYFNDIEMDIGDTDTL